MISDPQIIPHTFGFFVEISQKLASNICHTGTDYYEYNEETTPKCMYSCWRNYGDNKSKQNKSRDNDDIGNLVVKRVAPEISEPLAMLFNYSISTSVFPEQIEIATVILIYILKKDNADIIF